jgi:nucleoside-diphosphate-sugar epimerase
VRLLLDAHLPGSRIGRELSARGHDVHALSNDPNAEGLEDEHVLALATAERRILVTHDVTGFPEILRNWAEARRSHGGVILVYGIRPDEFGAIVEGLTQLLGEASRQADWIDVVMALSRKASR